VAEGVRLSSACALAPVNERRFQNWRETRRPVELRSNLREVPTLVRDLVVEVGNALRVGGGGEIRTHETLASLPVFKTGAFNRSATPPKKVISDR
jgi:hypothetical protein